MIRPSNQLIREVTFIVTIIWLMSTPTSANASPPACHRNDVSMYMKSDAVVEAVVTKSRRWSEGAVTLHLVAKFKVLDVFKGDVEKDAILIITDTCLDEPVSRSCTRQICHQDLSQIFLQVLFRLDIYLYILLLSEYL